MTKSHIVILLSCLTCGVLAGADNEPEATAYNNATPIVEIDGVKLTLGDFEAKRPGGLFQARNNYYENQRRAIDEFVNQWLLEREAAKESITVNQLLERNINSAGFKTPSDETLRVYYEGVDTTEPFENVRDKIVEAIRTRRIARTKNAYIESLRSKAKVVMAVEPPRAPITLKSDALRGPADAPVTNATDIN